MVNRAAQQLGRLARGVPKKYSPEEIAIRTERMKEAKAKQTAQMRANPVAVIEQLPDGSWIGQRDGITKTGSSRKSVATMLYLAARKQKQGGKGNAD